jgi:hypothetical protein
LPRHVHGFLSETEIIIELGIDGKVRLSNRKDAVRPANAKKADIGKLLTKAAEHFDDLIELWERVHGTLKKTDE